MTLDEKLSDMKAKAEAATPGPWVDDDGNVFSAPISNANYEARSAARREGQTQPPHGYDGEVAKCEQGLPNFAADSAFIAAANPAAVLALVEVVEAAVPGMRLLSKVCSSSDVADDYLEAFDAAMIKLKGTT